MPSYTSSIAARSDFSRKHMNVSNEKNIKIVLKNEEAIRALEATYGPVNEAENKHSIKTLSAYLTSCGLRCVKCGLSRVSFSTLKFFKWNPYLICYGCQHREEELANHAYGTK
jgi:hypothetical protein